MVSEMPLLGAGPFTPGRSRILISCLDTWNGLVVLWRLLEAQGASDVVTVTLIRQAQQAKDALGSNPRRSWCVALSMDSRILGRPHTYPPAVFVSGGGTS
jgi:hypothetical protein